MGLCTEGKKKKKRYLATSAGTTETYYKTVSHPVFSLVFADLVLHTEVVASTYMHAGPNENRW